jgi:hypothetical protein
VKIVLVLSNVAVLFYKQKMAALAALRTTHAVQHASSFFSVPSVFFVSSVLIPFFCLFFEFLPSDFLPAAIPFVHGTGWCRASHS